MRRKKKMKKSGILLTIIIFSMISICLGIGLYFGFSKFLSNDKDNGEDINKEPIIEEKVYEASLIGVGDNLIHSSVYNDAHIGNGRPVIFFDVVNRFFKYLGYKVTMVENFTDIDDKIIKKALEEGVKE